MDIQFICSFNVDFFIERLNKVQACWLVKNRWTATTRLPRSGWVCGLCEERNDEAIQ